MSTTTDTQAASAQIPQNDSINTATADLELTSTHDPETHHRINRVIVIGLDHSKHSKEAFDWTVANLLRKESDLTVLVNVRPIPAIPGPYVLLSALGLNTLSGNKLIVCYTRALILQIILSHRCPLHGLYRDHYESRRTGMFLTLHQLLQEYAAILKAQNFGVVSKVLTLYFPSPKKFACKAIAMRGDPRDEIVRKVSEVNANTLVIGSRGLGALKRYLEYNFGFRE
ncbi:hypothetical protein G9A89_005309 [Geosiphon pyriformis]|nr:hypothetical protein G9A89_005309 [Geosiphon pyriformis]